jgi:protein-S-isoprenylcysteine O-methyltransferase Ste14
MTDDTKTEKDGNNKDANREDKGKPSLQKLSITMDKRVELAVAAAVVLFGVLLIVDARGIEEGLLPDPIGSRGMPEITGIFLIIVGIILGVMRLATWSVLPGHLVPSEGHEDEEGHPASWVRAFSIILAAWLSVWLQRSLSYLIATPLFLFVALWFLGVRSWGKLIAFPIIFTLAVWCIFSQVLGFVIPLGFLTPFARSLGLTP